MTFKFDPMPGATLYRQGAEARLFLGEYQGCPALAKHRFPKSYRHPKLDEQLTKERLKAEVRSLVRCKTLGIRTPTIYFTDAETGVIVMEYLDNAITTKDYIIQRMSVKPYDVNPEKHPELEQLARKIGRILGRLHSNNLIHGDLTTSNMLIENDGEITLIDFGLGYAEGSVEDKGVDIYVLERALVSTHPNSESLFQIMREAYNEEFKNKKEREEIIKKYEEIRLRGRKRTMLG